MEFLKTVVSHPAFWGFCGGFFLFCLSFVSHWKTKRELKRFQQHLSDKLELEAKQYELVRKEREQFAKENENLRIKVGQLIEKPDAKLQRDIEVIVRAEKKMMIGAPGFAAAWETAKAESAKEVEEEERGKSMPKRFFTRLFGTGGDKEGEAHHLIEEDSGTAHGANGESAAANGADVAHGSGRSA